MTIGGVAVCFACSRSCKLPVASPAGGIAQPRLSPLSCGRKPSSHPLWPFTASHVLSQMGNEKLRVRAPLFEQLSADPPRLAALFARLCDAELVAQVPGAWRRHVVRFVVGAFESLAIEAVRTPLLRLVRRE